MVTLPSGGLTVLSVSSALQGRIYQGSGKFFLAKKIFFASPPPYFGDAGHTGDIQFLQFHSFTLLLFGFCHALRPPVPPVGPDPR